MLWQSVQRLFGHYGFGEAARGDFTAHRVRFIVERRTCAASRVLPQIKKEGYYMKKALMALAALLLCLSLAACSGGNGPAKENPADEDNALQVLTKYYQCSVQYDMLGALDCVFPEYRQTVIGQYGGEANIRQSFTQNPDEKERVTAKVSVAAIDKDTYSDETNFSEITESLASTYSIEKDKIEAVWVYNLKLEMSNAEGTNEQNVTCPAVKYKGSWYICHF